MQTNLWRYLEYREPRSHPRPSAKTNAELLHRGDAWMYWSDGAVTSCTDTPDSQRSLAADASSLIDLVWGSHSFSTFAEWRWLASIERIEEREILGIAKPLPWRGKLERLSVEYRNGDRGSLFLHSFQRGSGYFIEPSKTFSAEVANTLEKPEPMLVYEVFLDSSLPPPPNWPKDAPSAIVCRPSAHCVTVFHGEHRADVESLRDVMTQHRIPPEGLWLASAFIEGASPLDLARAEVERLSGLSCRGTNEEVFVEGEGQSLGPCRSYEEVLRALHQLQRKNTRWHMSERRAHFRIK